MQIKTLFKTARCVTVEIRNGNIFETEHEYEIYVNGTSRDDQTCHHEYI
jgi:hypothetical protein